MYKELYSSSLENKSREQLFNCHLEHISPDVSFSSEKIDELTETLILTETQKLIAGFLNLNCYSQIIFGREVEDLIYYIFQAFPHKKIRILTSDSESINYETFNNTLNLEFTTVPTMPFDYFEEEFLNLVQNNHFDLIIISHVFYNSGLLIKDIESFISKFPSHSTVIIDGRFGFMANPIDLSKIKNSIFYIADSKHFAQSDEAICFMTCPELNFGEKQELNIISMMKFKRVLDFIKSKNISVELIHDHIQKIQAHFLIALRKLDHAVICEKNIIALDYKHHGHFFTFALSSEKVAKSIHSQLKKLNIISVLCGSRIQFGFGLYHDENFDLSSINEILKF